MHFPVFFGLQNYFDRVFTYYAKNVSIIAKKKLTTLQCMVYLFFAPVKKIDRLFFKLKNTSVGFFLFLLTFCYLGA
ncbi:MAG: hypothetical protein DRP59_07445 [Spirochaetes bacterium]|nr:MAG: hypothetical protein DRP59_07445 [Spirochaetota bacterium]